MASSEQSEGNKVRTQPRWLIEPEERAGLISAGSSWSPYGVLRCVSLTHRHTKTEKLQANTTSVRYVANDLQPPPRERTLWSARTAAGSEFVLTHDYFRLFKIAGVPSAIRNILVF